MPNYEMTPEMAFTGLLIQNHPGAIAWINSDTPGSGPSGTVKFYYTIYGGILVEADFRPSQHRCPRRK